MSVGSSAAHSSSSGRSEGHRDGDLPVEPFPETRTAVAPRGRISDPRYTVPLALFLLAVGAFTLWSVTDQGGPAALGWTFFLVTWGFAAAFLWISARRWAWMRAHRRSTGHYPEV